MSFHLKRFLPHIIAFLLFVTASLAYFYPVLSGQKIAQSDIVQFSGMSKQIVEFRKETGEEPYWLDNAFVGMPSYQVSTQYPHDYIKTLDITIRSLPRPAGTLFLYFAGLYVLLLVMKVDWRLAILGALAFGFSTYMIILLGIGHNSKAIAIGYMPLVLAGILLTFQRKYLWGFAITTLSLALNISANHYQMTYYLLLLVLALGVVYLVQAFKEKELPQFFKTVGMLAVAALLALAMNSSKLLATQEYTEFSTRGTSQLTINPDGTPKESNSGLSKEYITEYSYGITESLNLFAARLFGGSSSEALDIDSHAYEVLVKEMNVPTRQAREIIRGLPLYWADQPFIGAPAYIGAMVVFLFVLALFLVKGPTKYWLVAGTLLSLFLSWGKNFEFLTNLMIDHMPLYDKFRAVSSIQVILELCIPVLAFIGLSKFFSNETPSDEKWKALKWSVMIVGGIAVLLLLFKGVFSFTGPNDAYYRDNYYGFDLMEAIKEDRKAMFTADLLRSLGFVVVAALALYFLFKEKLKENIAIILLGGLLLFDLVSVNWRYVNDEDFVSRRTYDRPFVATEADRQILQDPGHFRVYEPALGMSNGRTAYFHKTIAGYHGAKPAAIQELYDFHIAKNNIQVLNMLNVKYVIRQGEDQQAVALSNPNANGNAWFVDEIRVLEDADAVISSLDTLNTKRFAVTLSKEVEERGVAQQFSNRVSDSIYLTAYQPNSLRYQSVRQLEGLAVFSEMYYADGWNAYIDDELVPHFKVNHALRALYMPAGKHTIEFHFEPKVIQRGATITLAGYGIFVLLMLGAGYRYYKKQEDVRG